jgi:hypothetical protein
MKTIFKNGAYERVSDEVAEISVRHQGAKYVSKSEWKLNARNITKSETVIEAESKGEVTKSKKAEKAAKLREKQRQ